MAKETSRTMIAIVAVLALVIGVGGTWAFMSNQQAEEASLTRTTDFDGAFATFQPLQEVTGYNDLTVTEQSLNSSGDVDDGNVVASFNVNNTDGQVLRFAYGIDVNGPMESVDVEGTVASDTVDSAFDVRTAKVIPDEDDEISIDDAQPVQEFNVDSNDEFDGTINGLKEGEYAYVMEVRGVDTSQISTDDDLYTQDFDAQTDADSDEAEEMHVTLDNAQ